MLCTRLFGTLEYACCLFVSNIFRRKNLIEIFFKKVKGTHQIEMQEEHVIDTLNNEDTGIKF